MARVEGIDPRQTSFLMRQVFQESAQDVGPRPDAAKGRSPSAQGVLGKCARGVAAGTESGGAAKAAHAVDAPNCRAGWVPVLNRCQFCRGQNVRFERRRDYRNPRGTLRRFSTTRDRFAAHGGRDGGHAVQCERRTLWRIAPALFRGATDRTRSECGARELPCTL
jgi:hypothetical protein